MTRRVLIIGGYGNFGTFIARHLAQGSGLQLVIAGRSLDKAAALARELNAEALELDIEKNLVDALASARPDIVIHTSGPFQSQEPFVARACIEQGCHYIDLADGRAFVEGISRLDRDARDKGVLVMTGASSVPCLTSAILDHYTNEFSQMTALDYSITTAQRTGRGLATTAAILSYTGQPFKTLIDGHMATVHGWQDLHAHNYPGAGRRLLGNCNIPDLDLFPKRYPDLKTIRFYAGLELPLVHLTLWALSWLVRGRVIRGLDKAAPALLKLSNLFDRFGSSTSAFHMKISGTGKTGETKVVTFDLTARAGDGPYIPCMPAILMTRKIACGKISDIGAHPCMGFITLEEYLEALADLNISWQP